MLMGGDDVPSELITVDPWGGHVMARLDDGWCAALDRNTMLCGIYERGPTICREYQTGGSDCLIERQSIADIVNDAVKASLAEDADDLATFSARKNEKSLSFDTFVRGLKRRGRI
jgi:Fe-S-cluster containining protein